jgi:hypothetical protein
MLPTLDDAKEETVEVPPDDEGAGIRVCPRCGEPVRQSRFCATCGLNIAAQLEIPTRAEWEAGDEFPLVVPSADDRDHAAHEPKSSGSIALSTPVDPDGQRATQAAIIDSLTTWVLKPRVRAEIAALPLILEPDEMPETLLYGVRNDGLFVKLYGKRDLERLVVATDRRVLLVPHLRASALKPEAYPYSEITGVRERGSRAAGVGVRIAADALTSGMSGLLKIGYSSVAFEHEGRWVTVAQIQPPLRARQLATAIRQRMQS